MKTKIHAAFTLVEILITVAIIAIIVGISIPALGAAREKSERRTADANAALISTGIVRAHLDGMNDPVLVGSDITAIATYLVENGYVEVK